ncbi:hypothetical protein GB937_003327 [Aspergillus fischeri]|nr:hypothetical protein GB937_003327 [Aspergillus fischeri]
MATGGLTIIEAYRLDARFNVSGAGGCVRKTPNIGKRDVELEQESREPILLPQRLGFHSPGWTRPDQFLDTCHNQAGHRSHGLTLFANGQAFNDLAVSQPDDEIHYSEGVIRDPPGQEDRNLVENQRVNVMYFILSHSLDSEILGQYIHVHICPSEPGQAHWNSSKP